jgi:hypothetical protein
MEQQQEESKELSARHEPVSVRGVNYFCRSH